MKQYSATHARAHWFAILDDVVGGEAVVIERKGRRVVLRCEEPTLASIPDYSKVIQSPDADNADQWTWNWDPDGGIKLAP